jgi:hypothetical protein
MGQRQLIADSADEESPQKRSLPEKKEPPPLSKKRSFLNGIVVEWHVTTLQIPGHLSSDHHQFPVGPEHYHAATPSASAIRSTNQQLDGCGFQPTAEHFGSGRGTMDSGGRLSKAEVKNSDSTKVN